MATQLKQVGDDELVERLRVLRADDKRTTAYDDQTIDADISRLQIQLTWPWCFDMGKAPKNKRILLDTPWGVVVGRWRYEEPASDCARAMVYAGWESEGGETWPPHNMGDEGDEPQHGMPTAWSFLPISSTSEEE